MEPRPTVRDVAAAAGVSVATVSLVMRGMGRISPETRARVLATAESLGYRRDLRAVALREGRSRLVAVVMAAYRDPIEARAFNAFWSDAVNECALGLAERGYALVLVPPAHIDILERVAVDLALIADPGVDNTIHSQLMSLGVPLASGADGSGPGINFREDYQGLINASVDWLRTRGCTRVLALAPAPGAAIADANIDLLRDACNRADLALVVSACGFEESAITDAYVDGIASGCDGVFDMVASQARLAALASAAGVATPGAVPTIIYADPRAVPAVGVAVAIVSPNSLGRATAQAVADYLDAGRSQAQAVHVPYELLTAD